jgi:hypothetical protein
MNAALPQLAFLALALLASLVAGIAALRAHWSGALALNLAALVFLGQFGLMVVLVGFGAPPTVAQGAALGLGVAATWPPG